MPIVEQPVESVALVFAVLCHDASQLSRTSMQLEDLFGNIQTRSEVFPFDFSTYYSEEMGDGLIKQLLRITAPVDPAVLYDIKRRTMQLERELAESTRGALRRRANVDPGLVSVESLVLATTKYSGHRICIGPGLFAETTLLFQKGRCQPMQWTYPDYKTPVVQNFLLNVRGGLLQRRRVAENDSSTV